jgi:phospholipid/cholesterol/gamma-HCH transport system substrate-binding protein
MAISTEKKVGFFFLLTLLALGVLIEVVEDWNPFEKRERYHAYFQSSVGLQPGDPVRMAGVDVGKVGKITLEDGRVRIDFHVQRGTLLKTDSVAGIRRTNLLGGQFLGLDFGSPESPELPPGSQVKSEEGLSIDQLLANFDRNVARVMSEVSGLVQGPMTETMQRMQSIVTKVDEGEGTLGRIINDPTVYNDLTVAVNDLKGIIRRVDQGEGSLGRLINDPAFYEEARLTASNLREISDRLRKGEGTLGQLIVDDQLYEDAAAALVEIRAIAGKANKGEGTLGKLVNDPALYDEMRGAMARVNSIAAKIDNGDGTLGRLVNEDDLYRDAKTTLHKVEKTVDGMSDSGPLSALGVVLGTLF